MHMPPAPHTDTPIMRPGRGCGLLFFALMAIVAAAFGAGLGGFLWVLQDARSTIVALEDFRPRVGTKIYSSDGELLGDFAIEQRKLIRLSDMSPNIIKAFIATEDDRFYAHPGVRPDAILNALIYKLQTGRTRGGSTITQQVVRNVEDLKVGLDDTIQRKIREALVALQIEREFTKDEILELYLNQVFLGISAHGVEAASQQYFDKSARDVSLGEAAMLAGLTRSPNRNEPIHNPQNAKARRDIVLAQMLENRFITREEYERAIKEDLDASVITPEEREQLRKQGIGKWAPNRFKAPYFVEEIRRILLSQYSTEQVFGEGLEVHTTIDMRLQRAAEAALIPALEAFDAARLKSLEAQRRTAEFTPVSGALVCIDNRPPYQGYVRAMVGGRDFDQQKFNMATQALRQPGSSIKPFVWAAAVDNGMTASTIIVDEPFVRIAGNGQRWAPKNFDGKFNGPISLRHALEKSVNIVSIKLVEQLGVPLVRSYLERCGINCSAAAGLTLALGTPEVTVLQHCTAYSVFPNKGIRYEPVLLTQVRNRDGIVQFDAAQTERQKSIALRPEVAYVVLHMLEGVATADHRLGLYPTGWRTEALGRPRAGKTGTTNSSRDVWFCGFTPDYTCVVWIGYADNRALGAGRDFTGGRLAVPIWTEFMKAAHEGLPIRDFEVPETGVVFYNINRISGVLGGNYREAYVQGTMPPSVWTGGTSTEGEYADPNAPPRLLEALEPREATPLPSGTEPYDPEAVALEPRL